MKAVKIVSMPEAPKVHAAETESVKYENRFYDPPAKPEFSKDDVHDFLRSLAVAFDRGIAIASYPTYTHDREHAAIQNKNARDIMEAAAYYLLHDPSDL